MRVESTGVEGLWRLGLGGWELRRVLGVRERGEGLVRGRFPVLRARRWARREFMRGTAVSSLMGEEPLRVGLRELESRVVVVISPG